MSKKRNLQQRLERLNQISNPMLIERVEPSDVHLDCTNSRCGAEGVLPFFMEVGPHIKANCPECGYWIKFVKQVAPTV